MPVKPGYLTTEFWVVVLTAVGSVVAAAASWLTPRYAALASAVAAGAYSIARGLAKHPAAVVNPPPPPAS
jgi:hypothetical protein